MSVAENFEKLLNDFFTLYHPRQVEKVDKIVEEFKGQEITLLKALCDKYKKAYKVIPGLTEAMQAPAPTPLIETPVQIELTEEKIIEEEVTEEKQEEITDKEEEEEK